MTAPTGGWIALAAGGGRFALPAASILRIVPAEEIVTLPLTRPEVVGVILLDGRAVPVYRLPAVLGAAGTASARDAETGRHVVVVEEGGGVAGFLVEAAERARPPLEAGVRPLEARRLLAAAGGGAASATAAQAAEGGSR